MVNIVGLVALGAAIIIYGHTFSPLFYKHTGMMPGSGKGFRNYY